MSPEVAVAVCTNRRPEAVAESLSALRAQVSEGRLALVLNGLSAAEAEAHRREFAGPVLEEPRPGLSLARNRALEWWPDGVLAFVDDDAVAGAGWYRALVDAWVAAPDDVACIGGPIRPRWTVPPPDWISDAILPALTLLDLGPDVRDLDPSVTTVYGANISFRSRALRQIGGFDPAFGHRGERLFFSEEDEAQRALERAGHRVRYVPDVMVEHVIGAERLTRASFVRRRFFYGTTLGIRGARTRRVAARQAASSGAGALVAAAGRRDALAMERAVRAAENLGVLLGPRVARRAR